ncbi:hypothetical protein [Actinophytocola sp.]|uniref:hypothetical protein n=1 Tax=Actinophytocola sp. TaxID=1872138 RepID=UPI003D6C596E
MLILGLLLVVVSVAAAAVLIAFNGGGGAESVAVFGQDLGNVTLVQAFVAGTVVALVFLLGVWMIVSAGRRGRESRARYREARREARHAAKERDELADRVRRDDEQRAEQETAAMPPTGTPATPVEPGRHTTPPADKNK